MDLLTTLRGNAATKAATTARARLQSATSGAVAVRDGLRAQVAAAKAQLARLEADLQEQEAALQALRDQVRTYYGQYNPGGDLDPPPAPWWHSLLSKIFQG